MVTKQKINAVVRPVPSNPGSNQVTIMDLINKKGGSEATNEMPKGRLMPDGAAKAGGRRI